MKPNLTDSSYSTIQHILPSTEQQPLFACFEVSEVIVWFKQHHAFFQACLDGRIKQWALNKLIEDKNFRCHYDNLESLKQELDVALEQKVTVSTKLRHTQDPWTCFITCFLKLNYIINEKNIPIPYHEASSFLKRKADNEMQLYLDSNEQIYECFAYNLPRLTAVAAIWEKLNNISTPPLNTPEQAEAEFLEKMAQNHLKINFIINWLQKNFDFFNAYLNNEIKQWCNAINIDYSTKKNWDNINKFHVSFGKYFLNSKIKSTQMEGRNLNAFICFKQGFIRLNPDFLPAKLNDEKPGKLLENFLEANFHLVEFLAKNLPKLTITANVWSVQHTIGKDEFTPNDVFSKCIIAQAKIGFDSLLRSKTLKREHDEITTKTTTTLTNTKFHKIN